MKYVNIRYVCQKWWSRVECLLTELNAAEQNPNYFLLSHITYFSSQCLDSRADFILMQSHFFLNSLAPQTQKELKLFSVHVSSGSVNPL